MIDTCDFNENDKIADNKDKKIKGKSKTSTNNIHNGKNFQTEKTTYYYNFQKKNKTLENSELYFYNKNIINNGELKNFVKQKIRPKTNNHLKEMSVFSSKSNRILNRKEQVLNKNNEINSANNRLYSANHSSINCIKPRIINREHSSINNKDLSKNICVMKLGLS